MRIPSRRMSAARAHKTSIWAYPLLALTVIGIGYFVFKWPCFLLVIVAVAIYSCVDTLRDRRNRRRIVSSRSGDGICTFARAFDCRHTDTWVLRAVYEELSRFLAVDGQPFPVRADDHCYERGLKIDPEDLEDLASDIAFRAGRSLDGSEKNPFYGKVQTVRDMVAFFENQPHLDRADSAEVCCEAVVKC
jgi:hypothetical protein